MNKFASLTSGLLARKGAAEPAATTYAEELLKRVDATGPDFRTYGYSGSSAFGRRSTASESSLFLDRPEPVSVEAPVLPPAPAPAPAPTPTPTPTRPLSATACHDGATGDTTHGCHADPDKTFHVNLRLKRKRFVRLKLASALLRRPTQDIVSEALDEWFAKLPPDVLGDCECMRGE
jgi:hypothetical protein